MFAGGNWNTVSSDRGRMGREKPLPSCGLEIADGDDSSENNCPLLNYHIIQEKKTLLQKYITKGMAL